MILDNCLSFKRYIDKTIASCNRLLFSLSRVRRYITPHIAIQIFKSLIMSKLNYGGVLCMGASQRNLNRLQKSQNRALRICLCTDCYTSNLKLHRDSNVLQLFLRRKLELYKCMYARMLCLESNQTCSSLNSIASTDMADRPQTCYNSASPHLLISLTTSVSSTRLPTRDRSFGPVHHLKSKI